MSGLIMAALALWFDVEKRKDTTEEPKQGRAHSCGLM